MSQRSRSDEGLTPAERALLAAIGPGFMSLEEFGPPEGSLAEAVAPDDWRLYHLMRELPEQDRRRILDFTEMLYNLRHARRWAGGQPGAALND